MLFFAAKKMSEEAFLKFKFFIIYSLWLSITQYHWAATTEKTTPTTSPSRIYRSLFELKPRTTRIKAGSTVQIISRVWLSYSILCLCLLAQNPKKQTKTIIKVISTFRTLLKTNITHNVNTDRHKSVVSSTNLCTEAIVDPLPCSRPHHVDTPWDGIHFVEKIRNVEAMKDI